MQDKSKQLERAYAEHSDALFRYCVFKLNDREMANDMLQETFVRAWNYLKQDKIVGNFKALLYKIMTNLIIDEYRRRKPVDSLETMREEAGFDPPFDDGDRWVDMIDGAQAIELIKKVPDPYGQAVFMRYVQELTLKEIAEITGERENTIAVHIHRGLEKLKALFHHEPK
jgi:RNA polymerase sigma-70 factor (ECF subfamily)